MMYILLPFLGLRKGFFIIMENYDDIAIKYEYIICRCYNCKRYDCDSADADIFRKLVRLYFLPQKDSSVEYREQEMVVVQNIKEALTFIHKTNLLELLDCSNGQDTMGLDNISDAIIKILDSL